MYPIVKFFLFLRSPEKIHYWVMKRLQKMYKKPLLRSFLRKRFSYSHPKLERELWGLKFPNPVGLAAGFDKDARYVDELSCLGFGFIEIGTLTPIPQDGNPKPRLFRLPKDQALVNRMGFNNNGVRTAAARLKRRESRTIIGGNIGKNKKTPNERAVSDYETCFRVLYDHVDYFTVNVSSPNTPGLRALQDKEPLRQLLEHLQKINEELGSPKPILLKIAPDLSTAELDDMIEIVAATKIGGVVATNTTISRTGLKTDQGKLESIGNGGLSGKPLRERATGVIRYIHEKTKGEVPIIAVGGIFTAEDAIEKLNAGASLVQIYTGFIYEGPAIVKNICKKLVEA